MSHAEKISSRFGDDGQHWTDADGIELLDALRQAGARCTPDRHAAPHRWELPDGSAIVIDESGWDLGIPSTDDDDRRDCTCWVGSHAGDRTTSCLEPDSCSCACHASEGTAA